MNYAADKDVAMSQKHNYKDLINLQHLHNHNKKFSFERLAFMLLNVCL